MPYGSKTNSRYYNSEIIKKRGKNCYATVVYSIIPEQDGDLVLRTVVGDRFDLLAEKYYGDAALWWYLAKANDLKLNSIPSNSIIRIPSSIAYAKEV